MHHWKADEEALLVVATECAQSLYKHYEQQGPPSLRLWDAVAGILAVAGGPVVTGCACHRRMEVIGAREQASAKKIASEAPPVIADSKANCATVLAAIAEVRAEQYRCSRVLEILVIQMGVEVPPPVGDG